MAVSFTYDDFLNKYNSSGIGFSDADLALAKQNPNAGMGLIDAKVRYKNATTAAERAKYNQQAEQIRSLYGGYTGGSDGWGYNPTSSPNDFGSDSFGFSESKPEFSYSTETDPLYSAYKKQYNREGDRAMQDALGAASAATGGVPSSYATAAATQAGDYYASQLSDKVPELYQQAYNQYLNELNQWNTDRSFAYGQYIDELNQQTANRQEALQNALYAAQYGDYSKLAGLGFDVSNIPDDYNKKYNLAILAGQYGDYEKLKELLGINVDKNVINNTDSQNLEMMYNLAIAKANAGDYSYLNKLLAQYFK